MSARRRNPGPARISGPVSVNLPGSRRVQDLHASLAGFLAEPAILDDDRLEAALAYAFDTSSLASGDCRAQTTMVLLGFRDLRPTGILDPPLAFLVVLAILDANGFLFEDVPYAELVARLQGLPDLRPEQGETEGLQQWLIAQTRSTEGRMVPLPTAELKRLLEPHGFRLEVQEGQLLVLKPEFLQPQGSWLSKAFRKPAWERVHGLADPGDGLIGVAGIRSLREACGLTAEPFIDDRAWQEGTLRHYRHLWPRLRGLWKDRAEPA